MGQFHQVWGHQKNSKRHLVWGKGTHTEAWGSHSMCPEGNCHAWVTLACGQTTGLCTGKQAWQWLGDVGTVLRSGWDSLRGWEPDQKWGTLWEGCQDEALQPCPVAPFETVFSLPSHFLKVKSGRLHLPLQGLQGQACQYSAVESAPRGSVLFFLCEVSSSDLKLVNFLAH